MAVIQIETITPPVGQLLVPQASDPATNAAAAQVYAKTDNNLYHKDITGAVSNLLVGQQIASSALGNNTIAWPYGCLNASFPGYLNSGAAQNYGKGFVATQSGSIVGAFMVGNAGSAYSGNLVVYKNGASFFTALTSVVMNTAQGIANQKYASFANGLYPLAPGDALDLYYTATGSSVYAGAGLIVNLGNTTASAISTPLTANTTVATTDNQRVWVASAATQYTLTLPPTQSGQDFYVRAAVTGGGGVKVQAPSGVTIYNGTSSSTAGGTMTATAAGAYALLYNPAGTSLWTMVSPSALWTAA